MGFFKVAAPFSVIFIEQLFSRRFAAGRNLFQIYRNRLSSAPAPSPRAFFKPCAAIGTISRAISNKVPPRAV